MTPFERRERQLLFQRYRPPLGDLLLVSFVGGPKDGHKAVFHRPPREMKAVKLPEFNAATWLSEPEIPSMAPALDIITYRFVYWFHPDLDRSFWQYRSPDRLYEEGVFVW